MILVLSLLALLITGVLFTGAVAKQKSKSLIFVQLNPWNDLCLSFRYTKDGKEWKNKKISVAHIIVANKGSLGELLASTFTDNNPFRWIGIEDTKAEFDPKTIQVRIMGDKLTFTQKIIDTLAGVKYPELQGEEDEQRSKYSQK